jgi:hypothetical protein
MPDSSLKSLFKKTIFLILSFLVVVLFIAAIWELGPFYGYALDNTPFGVIGQAVQGINDAMFQFSLDLYVWYTFMWILVAVALCSIGLLTLSFGFLAKIRSNKEHRTRKLPGSLEHTSVLGVVKRLSKRLMWPFLEVGEKFKKRRPADAVNEFAAKRKRWKTYGWQISLISIVGLIAFTYRYAIFPVPQGWDTAWYTYTIRSLQQNPALFRTVDPGRILSIAVMYAITLISGLTAEQTMMILTPLIGLLFMAGVYLLVVTGTKNKLVGLLAALYTSLTYATMRMSSDLYSNFIGWTLAMYALTLYIRTMRTKETKLKYIVATATLFAMTALAHIWSFVFLTGIIVLENLLELLTNKDHRKIIQRTVVIYSPFIIAAIITPYIQAVVLGNLSQFALLSAQFPVDDASLENPYLLFLAIIGIIVIASYKGTTYTRIIISWTMVTSIAMTLATFTFPYRIPILVPIAVLAAHGTQAISKGITRLHSSNLLTKPLLPMIFLLSFTAAIPNAYLPQFALRPANDAMQQLYWIEQHYGFGNSSVVVCVDMWPPSINGMDFSNYYYWSLATVGNVVYDGLLLYLLQGIPDNEGTTFQGIAGKTILIPDMFYGMSAIEYEASQRVSDLGIYEVKLKTLAQIDQLLRNDSIWSEDTFGKEEWIPSVYPWDYQYNVTYEADIMNISVIPLRPNVWFAVERLLPAPIHNVSDLILKAKGNINSLSFVVNVYSNTSELAWKGFSQYLTAKNYSYLQMNLTPNTSISRLRLSINSGTGPFIESYIQVDYIALV